MQQRSNASPYPDLLIDAQHWITEAFNRAAQQGAEAGVGAVAQVKFLIEDTQLRLDAMLSHALSRADAERLTQTIEEISKRSVELNPMKDGGLLLGWWVQFKD